MRKLFALLMITVYAMAYPPCENHTNYLLNEREQFNVVGSPFDMDYLFNQTHTVPTSCVDQNDQFVPLIGGSCHFISNNSIYAMQPPTDRFPLLDTLGWKLTDWMWELSGWTKIIKDGEHYWYYPNPSSTHMVFYLHGVNAVNGFENIVLLNYLTQTASVFISVYSPVLFMDADYEYTHTYSRHIDNIATFIDGHMGLTTEIIGNSYGTIRVTTLCKRYSSMCDQMKHIVLTDPLNLNLPFSKTFDACLYGIFFFHPVKTPIYRKSITINTLRLRRYYMHLYDQMDWYEWSIDTHMMKRFSKNMVLVIGEHDNLITINRNSPAMQLCRVMYTNTRHGMVIFTNFMQQIRNECFV